MKPKVTMQSPPTSNAGKPKGLFEAVEEEPRLRSYSPKTAKVYLGQLRAFVRFFKPRHPRELSDEDIRRYLLYLTDNELAAAALAKRQVIPKAAQDLMSKPVIPAWAYRLLGNLHWKKAAKSYGVGKSLKKQPLRV